MKGSRSRAGPVQPKSTADPPIGAGLSVDSADAPPGCRARREDLLEPAPAGVLGGARSIESPVGVRKSDLHAPADGYRSVDHAICRQTEFAHRTVQPNPRVRKPLRRSSWRERKPSGIGRDRVRRPAWCRPGPPLSAEQWRAFRAAKPRGRCRPPRRVASLPQESAGWRRLRGGQREQLGSERA